MIFADATIYAWVKSLITFLIAYLLLSDLSSINFLLCIDVFLKLILALTICGFFNFLIYKANKSINQFIPYIMFFMITATSLLGLSKTLTGSHSESANIALYGLSFYTATLAYLSKKNNITRFTAFIASNPLLLITGPIVTTFHFVNFKSTINRIDYHIPFIILGIFLHQVIATPLTQSFDIIEKVDIISTLSFSLIFEIFVYTNFCGLSLIIYGLAGIIGIRIPLNFRQPFSSNNLIDFWKGWHISISMVLKELFFIPVKKVAGTNLAIFVVFLSSALWHGVSLNFLIWGMFHALCFILTIQLLKHNVKILPSIVLVIAIPLARILSSDADSNRLFEKLHFCYHNLNTIWRINLLPNTTKMAIVLGLTFILLEFFLKNNKNFNRRNYKLYRLPGVQLAILMLTILSISNNSGINYAVYGQR